MLNEAENLSELYSRLTATLTTLRRPFELMLVDDGSSDATPVLLKELAEQDPRVRVLRLDRNYGQHAALMAGLRHAHGAVVVTLDADLQTPPEAIPLLLATLDNDFDVVFGVFHQPVHPPLQRSLSWIGHAVLERVLGLPRDVSFSPFRALTRPVVDRLTECTDSPVQLETLLTRCASKMGAVPVRHQPRRAGETKYTLRRRLRFAFNLVHGLCGLRHNGGAPQPQYIIAERRGFPGGAIPR